MEILRANLPVRRIVFAEGAHAPEFEEIKKEAQSRGVAIEGITRRGLEAVTHGNHQGVAAQIDPISPVPFKVFMNQLRIDKKTFVCLLDEIQDPQNLGAIIRNAVCFGCSGIILPKWRSAGLTPAVMKASSGALAYCPIAEIPNLGVAVERLKEKGFFVYGADAQEGSVPLESLELDGPLAIILGSEHEGIKPILKKACDNLVRISQKTSIQSLNVASASAVFFHEISARSSGK